MFRCPLNDGLSVYDRDSYRRCDRSESCAPCRFAAPSWDSALDGAFKGGGSTPPPWCRHRAITREEARRRASVVRRCAFGGACAAVAALWALVR